MALYVLKQERRFFLPMYLTIMSQMSCNLSVHKGIHFLVIARSLSFILVALCHVACVSLGPFTFEITSVRN